MSPEKGPAEAIRIARRAGIPLLIGAKCREDAEHAYFAEHVEPQLGPDVVWLGELNATEKFDLLAGARALVFPISWQEPFGMVMIEAMACGTPVLATARGSVPEVVADGVTGFVRASPDELVATVSEWPPRLRGPLCLGRFRGHPKAPDTPGERSRPCRQTRTGDLADSVDEDRHPVGARPVGERIEADGA
jgi:glycosyltransferase involved in cell wall biosynthesis